MIFSRTIRIPIFVGVSISDCDPDRGHSFAVGIFGVFGPATYPLLARLPICAKKFSPMCIVSRKSRG